jgi:hypothetical protein
MSLYTAQVRDGEVSINLPKTLAPGTYTVKTEFLQDNKYKKATTQNTLTISRGNYIINIEELTIKYYESTTNTVIRVKAKITDQNGLKPKKYPTAAIKLGGKTTLFDPKEINDECWLDETFEVTYLKLSNKEEYEVFLVLGLNTYYNSLRESHIVPIQKFD